MLYFQFNFAANDGTIEAVTYDGLDEDKPYLYRGDFDTFEKAEYIADCLNNLNRDKSLRGKDTYIATDAGPCVSPRYDVQRRPQVGDEVSYGFNGDYYPCGTIVKISPTLKKITTSSGHTFYRLRQTGSWKMNKTWSLVQGHHDERNPHF